MSAECQFYRLSTKILTTIQVNQIVTVLSKNDAKYTSGFVCMQWKSKYVILYSAHYSLTLCSYVHIMCSLKTFDV